MSEDSDHSFDYPISRHQIWQPTMELRIWFPGELDASGNVAGEIQQKWINSSTNKSEWRPLPQVHEGDERSTP